MPKHTRVECERAIRLSHDNVAPSVIAQQISMPRKDDWTSKKMFLTNLNNVRPCTFMTSSFNDRTSSSIKSLVKTAKSILSSDSDS